MNYLAQVTLCRLAREHLSNLLLVHLNITAIPSKEPSVKLPIHVSGATDRSHHGRTRCRRVLIYALTHPCLNVQFIGLKSEKKLITVLYTELHFCDASKWKYVMLLSCVETRRFHAHSNDGMIVHCTYNDELFDNTKRLSP